MKFALCFASFLMFYTAVALAETVQTEAGPMSITQVSMGLEEPWGLAFLPDNAFLVTEREGRLWLSRDEVMREVDGLPDLFVDGQGGLLDVMVPDDFAISREVWLSFAAPVGEGAATAAGFGRLTEDETRIEGFQAVFIGEAHSGGRHFGARLVEMPGGTVALTTGDRGTGPEGMQAQDPQTSVGKLILMKRNGSSAVTQDGWLPGVFSLGHRNMQGAALDLSGRLLTHEHGAQGGDELNAPEVGRNYGWPVITYGIDYNGDPIGEGQVKSGMEQPLHYWDPSIAPSGLMVYSGKLVPEWRGDIFFGSLNSDYLGRLDPDTPAANGYTEERISSRETGRVRDVVEAPDGSIWFLSVHDGAIYRLAPAP